MFSPVTVTVTGPPMALLPAMPSAGSPLGPSTFAYQSPPSSLIAGGPFHMREIGPEALLANIRSAEEKVYAEAEKLPRAKQFVKFAKMEGYGEAGAMLSIQGALFGADVLGASRIMKTLLVVAADYLGFTAASYSAYFYNYSHSYRKGITDVVPFENIPAEYAHLINLVLHDLKGPRPQIDRQGALKEINNLLGTMEFTPPASLTEGDEKAVKLFQEDVRRLRSLYTEAMARFFNSPAFGPFMTSFHRPKYKDAARDILAFETVCLIPTAIAYSVLTPLTYLLLDTSLPNIAIGLIDSMVAGSIYLVAEFPFFEYVRTGRIWQHWDRLKKIVGLRSKGE